MLPVELHGRRGIPVQLEAAVIAPPYFHKSSLSLLHPHNQLLFKLSIIIQTSPAFLALKVSLLLSTSLSSVVQPWLYTSTPGVGHYTGTAPVQESAVMAIPAIPLVAVEFHAHLRGWEPVIPAA